MCERYLLGEAEICMIFVCVLFVSCGYSNMFDIMYLEPVCPLFWWLNPGLFQSKQWSFGFQVDMYGVFGSILHFIRKTVVPLGWCPSCSTLQGAPLTGDMGPNKYPRDIFGVYRVDDFSGPPSQGYHHFPYEHWDLYFFDMFFFEPPPPPFP